MKIWWETKVLVVIFVAIAFGPFAALAAVGGGDSRYQPTTQRRCPVTVRVGIVVRTEKWIPPTWTRPLPFETPAP